MFGETVPFNLERPMAIFLGRSMITFAFPEVGETVQHGDAVLTIEVVGTGPYIAWGRGLVPVAFTDKTVGLCVFRQVREGGNTGEPPPALYRAWVPDLPAAADVLRHATQVTVNHGIGSDVLHVHVTAQDGRRALIKLFYNSKKMQYDRQDELHWLPPETRAA